MTATLIPPTDLPAQATEGVMVDGVAVLRYGCSGWGFMPGFTAALWDRVRAEHPATDGEPVRSGSIPSANWSGEFTRTQSSAYAAAVSRLTSAAKRATAPKRAARRADREAAAARHVEAARAMYAAHDAACAARLAEARA